MFTISPVCPVAAIIPLFLFQVSTPVELPTLTLTPKQEMLKTASSTPPCTAPEVLSSNQKASMQTDTASVSGSQVSSSTAESLSVHDEDDEELEQLLSLQKPVGGVSGNQSVDVAEETSEHSVCFPT